MHASSEDIMHLRIALFWLAVISVISVIVTVYDKIRSRISRHGRVPEKALFFLAVLGGSTAMYLTMIIIRHKTLHKRFMIGLPLIILFQLGLVFYFFKFRG